MFVYLWLLEQVLTLVYLSFISPGVQVELVNLLDLQMLQGQSDSDDENGSDDENMQDILDLKKISSKSDADSDVEDEKDLITTMIQNELDRTKLIEEGNITAKEARVTENDADKDRDERDGQENLKGDILVDLHFAGPWVGNVKICAAIATFYPQLTF